MAVISSLPVGTTGEVLETAKLATNEHREGMFLGSPSVDAARAEVAKTIPDGSAYGLQAYVLGSVVVTSSVAVTGPLTDAQLRASAVPVSGTVTANAGTNLDTSALALDATLTGGTAKAINRGGAKGATTAADVTGTAEGADHQALDVQIYHGGVAKDPTQVRALISADVVTVQSITNALPAGSALLGKVGIDQTTPGTTNAVAVTNSFLLDATFTARINTQGQKTMALSTPVVLASDQAAIPITGGADHSLTFAGDKADVSGSSVSVSASALPTGASAIASGVQTLNAPGSRVQLPSQACKIVEIVAAESNNGLLAFGDANIIASPPFLRNGVALGPGDSLRLELDNLSRLYVDGTSWGDVFAWRTAS